MAIVKILRKLVPDSGNDYHFRVDGDPDGETHADPDEALISYVRREGRTGVKYDPEIVDE